VEHLLIVEHLLDVRRCRETVVFSVFECLLDNAGLALFRNAPDTARGVELLEDAMQRDKQLPHSKVRVSSS
jgi:hypothetical protein